MPASSTSAPYRAHRERQRVRILTAARRLFDQRGIDRVAVSEIIAAAGIRASTLYEYFSNKDEIVWALVEEYMRESAARTLAAVDAAQGSAIDKIAALFQAAEDDLVDRPERVRFMAQFDAMYAHDWSVEQLLAVEDRIATGRLNGLESLIRAGMSDGSLRSDLNPRLTMHAVMNALIGTQRRLASLGTRVEKEYGKPIVQLFRESIRILLLGLSAPASNSRKPKFISSSKSAQPKKRTAMPKSLRLVLAFSLALGSLVTLPIRAQLSPSPRQTFSADAHWKFFLGDPPNAQATSFSDASWRDVTLPHDWSIEAAPNKDNPSAGGGGYFPGGIGWYRRAFIAPASWRGKQVNVYFEGVAANATVYLNGHELGMHPYAYTSFRFDLTPWLNIGKSNLIAVRVDDSQQPASRWYVGAGIYRHVHVIVTDPIHVAPWGVFVTTPEATGDDAKLVVKTSVDNSTSQSAQVSVETTILSPDGQTVAHATTPLLVNEKSNAEATTDLSVAHPALWSPDEPRLYRAVTEVVQNGKPIDRTETTFGIRTLSWSVDQGLLLNGRSIKLQGGSVHHANGPLGAEAFDRAEERRVQLLKDAGFNAVRTAHNPPSPEFLAACDRLGLLVLDEPFDVWKTKKVDFDYAHLFDQWWRKDIDSMVLRDRNHPSIIIWGIGNEIPEAWTPAGAPIAKQLAGSIRALDNTRPITEAFPGATYTKNTDAVMAQLDIAGYNYNLVQNSQKDHERVPTRIMVSTETMPANAFSQWQTIHDHPYTIGEFVWTAMDYLGESGIGAPAILPDDQAKQAAAVTEMMKGAMANMGADGKNPFADFAEQQKKQEEEAKKQREEQAKQKKAAGNLMSLMFHGYPWHAADCGDIDLVGHRKPQSYYRDILWKGGDRVYATVRVPMPSGEQYIQIGWSVYPTMHSWTWPGQEGKDMQVEVYAGTEKVRLYLNGKLIGEQPTGVNEQRRALFTLPYAPGTLKAVGVNGDQEVAINTIETAGAPASLKLTADRTTLHADGEDLSYITVEAVDAEGRHEPNESAEVHFTVSGPATIEAVGNGDGQSTESYRGNQRALFHGRALVIVRTTTGTGAIHLEATAPGLSSASVELHAEPAAPRAELQ